MLTAVWGPPRSGKTTLAVDLAFALSRKGQSVCLVSPEAYSELSARLNINIPKQKSILAAYQGGGNLKQNVCRVDELFFVLAAPSYADAFSEDATGSDAQTLLRETVPVFDHVLVDCPSQPGSAVAARALNQADTVLLLTGCQSAACLWYGAFRRAVNALKDRTLCVSLEANDSFDYRALENLIGLRAEIRIPYVPDAEEVLRSRRTLYESGGKTGRACTAALDSLTDRLKGGTR